MNRAGMSDRSPRKREGPGPAPMASLQAPADCGVERGRRRRGRRSVGLRDGRQYPALSLDVDSDGRASWQEMGRQLRAGPALTAAAAVGPARVDLTCIGSVHMMELRAAVTALQ